MFGEDGIIKRAELAKQEMKLSEYEERIKIIVLDEHTGKRIDETKKNSKLIDLVKERLEEEEWVGSVEKVDGEDNQLRVITKDGYILVVEINEDGTVEIIEEGPDNGEPYPEIELTQIPLEGTENEKIKIKVVAKVRTTEKTKKISKVRIIKPEEKAQEKEYVDGGVIFEVEGNGKYIFEAESNVGNRSTKPISISIVEPESNITIEAEPTTARNTENTGTQNGVEKGAISVTINYGETSLQKLYKTENDSDWKSVTGDSVTFEVTENIAIYAKYYYGINSFDSVTYNIQNVDNVAPNAFNLTETHTTNSITVTAETEDTAADTAGNVAASGTEGILRYEYRIYKDGAWQSWQASNSFIELPTGQYKIQAKAIDKAGNQTYSTNTPWITLGTVSTEDISITATPTTAKNTAVTGTQNGVETGPISVTITYGNSSYTREYKKDTDTSWTTVSGTSVTFEVTENVAIYARYYDGTNGFQTQAYNIANVDNVAPTFSSYNATVSGATITATGTATDTAADTAGNVAASGIEGIKKYEYSNGGSTYQPGNSFTVSSAGTYTIYIKAIDNAGNETVVSKPVTVNSYTVTYDANGGSGAPVAQTAISGTNLTLSSTVPTSGGGDEFFGWSTSSIATREEYSAGQTITPTSNMTLYAVWNFSKGSFIKYNVEYTDTYYSSYEYSSTNGWRLMDYDLDKDGKTLKNVKLISTGIPARMYYQYSDKTNNYLQWVFDTDESIKPNLTTFKNEILGADYTIYSEGVAYSDYCGLQASAGFYYNLGKMTFSQGTSYDTRNMGYYTKVKNGSTTYTSGSTTGNNLFKARNDANIRMLTLPELNAAVGRTEVDSTDNFTDTTGIYQLNKISTETQLKNNTYSTTLISYWLASPLPIDKNALRVMRVSSQNGDMGNNYEGKSGVRPVVTLTADIQLTRKVDTDTGIAYYEIVDK